MNFDWGIEHFGGKVQIDPYDAMPTGTIAVIDVETDERDNLVCVGVCEDGITAKIFFDIRSELIEYLKQVQIVAHAGKGAEIPWLEKFGVTIDQLLFDTQIGMYVYDSTQKSYGLKKILERMWNIKYPTYEEITESQEFINEACLNNHTLYEIAKSKNKAVTFLNSGELEKENWRGVKLPKKLTLDKLPKEIVAAYNAADVFYTFRLYTWLRQNMTAAQLNFFNTIEMPLNRLIFHMERQGVKIDLKAVRRIHNEKSKERRKAKKQLFEFAGGAFNPNSPKQVLPLLHSLGAKTKTTGEDDIRRFSHIPFVETLLRYRGYQKLCSTYTIPLYANTINKPDGRIHARFNQNTITGRLSSSDPINLQNQPSGIRECFIGAANYNLIGSDWSNIELRLPAHFSGEPKFVSVFESNGDLHSVTAKFLFGQAFESGSEEERKSKRQKAKTCNFLLTNSGTANRLASELQISKEEAEGLFRKFWEGYPTLAAWLKEEKRKARMRGGVTTMYGRWVPIPTLNLWCGVSNCPVSGPNGFWCKQCFMREEAERTAMSVLVQGSAADMAKLSALRIYKEHGYVPILAVHDSLTYERPEAESEQALQNIKFAMENVVTLRVPLKVDISIGKRWCDVK